MGDISVYETANQIYMKDIEMVMTKLPRVRGKADDVNVIKGKLC